MVLNLAYRDTLRLENHQLGDDASLAGVKLMRVAARQLALCTARDQVRWDEPPFWSGPASCTGLCFCCILETSIGLDAVNCEWFLPNPYNEEGNSLGWFHGRAAHEVTRANTDVNNIAASSSEVEISISRMLIYYNCSFTNSGTSQQHD